MIETLAARVRQALGDNEGAAALLAQARARYPYSRPVLYAHVAALLDAGRNQDAAAQLVEAVRTYPNDPRLLALQSKAYAALGKRLLQHQAQAEVYVLQGALPAAIEQLHARARRGRRRLLPALGDRRAAQGPARAALAGNAGPEALGAARSWAASK